MSRPGDPVESKEQVGSFQCNKVGKVGGKRSPGPEIFGVF